MHGVARQPDAAEPRVVNLPDHVLRACLLALVHPVQGFQLADRDGAGYGVAAASAAADIT